MRLTCEDPSEKGFTWVIPPAVWLRDEGSQYFLVPGVLWLTWATLSCLHLLVLSAKIGPKQEKNQRLQIKTATVFCIFSSFPQLTSEKLPSSVVYKASPSLKWTVNFGSVWFFASCEARLESGPWRRIKVHSEVCLTRRYMTCRNLLCEQWPKRWGVHWGVILLPVSPEIKSESALQNKKKHIAIL